MNIHLDSLRTFLCLAQEGSFTGSAGTLRKSQSAISLQIAGLERQFGLQLIDRSVRPVRLTEAGRLFLDFSNRVVNQAADLERTMRDLATGAIGEVRIGATTSLGTYLLPQMITHLVRKFPRITITVMSLPKASVLAAVRSSEVDFAFILSDKMPDDLVVTTLRREALWFVVSPKSAFATQRPVTLAELSAFPFILGLKESQYSGIMESILEAKGFPKLSVAMRIGNYEGIKQAVRAGIGVALLPRFTVKTEVRDNVLLRVRTCGLSLNASIMLVERAEGLPRPAAATTKSFLSAALRR